MLAVDPSRRMTLAEVSAHPWMARYAPFFCSTLYADTLSNRQSQIPRKGLSALAEQLTESLRASGDLAIATPDALS